MIRPTPLWAREKGVDAGVSVVNFVQPDLRRSDPLEEWRDQARLVALRLLCVTGLGEGRDERGSVLIEIGLIGRPSRERLLGQVVSPLIWRCCQTGESTTLCHAGKVFKSVSAPISRRHAA